LIVTPISSPSVPKPTRTTGQKLHFSAASLCGLAALNRMTLYQGLMNRVDGFVHINACLAVADVRSITRATASLQHSPLARRGLLKPLCPVTFRTSAPTGRGSRNSVADDGRRHVHDR
jgi:hypothetical protein